MNFKILNIACEDVKACAQFEYRGHTISFSTIMKGSDVFVFLDGEPSSSDPFFKTVQEAIEYINTRVSTENPELDKVVKTVKVQPAN